MSSLKQQISSKLQLLPNQFQIYLQKLSKQSNIDTCQAILELLSQSLQSSKNANNKITSYSNNNKRNQIKQQQQKLATSFNFLVEKSFNNNFRNPEIWILYVDLMATRKINNVDIDIQMQLNQWKIMRIMQKSFQLFVESFQQQFTPIFQSLYFKLNSSHKIILQSLLTTCDIDQSSRSLFLKQTLIQYIQLGHTQLSKFYTFSQNYKLQFLQYKFSQYLTSLYKTLVQLNYQSINQNQQQILINRIASSDQLFSLIQQCIFIKDNQKSQQNQKREIQKLFNIQGTYHKQQCHNNIKALGLQILCTILNRYSRQSGLAQFDTCKPLNLMQNIIPSIINQLSQTKSNILHLAPNQKLSISMLCTIKKSIQFLFMNNFIWANYKRIFWNIVYPLMIVSDQQIRQYQDQAQGFIGQIQTLVQKQQDDLQKVQSVKTYSGFLLEKMVENIDGALTTITNQIISILSFIIEDNKNQIYVELCNIWKIKPSLQACLSVLIILTTKIKRRQDILNKIRDIFISNRSSIFKCKQIQKAYVILYLTYNFDQIFRQSAPKVTPVVFNQCTVDYYQWIAASLQQSQPITKCCLSFFKTYCDLQPSSTIILNQLCTMIENTKNIDIFQSISCTLHDMALILSFKQIRDILQRCVERVLIDNNEYIKSLRNSQIYSNVCMLKCFGIIRKIGQLGRSFGEQGQQIMGIIWKVFDLFQFVYETNYGEDLVKIFDTVLSFVKKVQGPAFFQFLPNFAQLHKKQKQLGRLFETYQNLLIKGQDYLLKDSQGSTYLSQIVQNIMIIIRYCFRNRSTIAIVLLQYILIQFPNIKCDHEQIYLKTKQILQIRNDLTGQNVCAIYNLWIIGSCHWQGYDLSQLDRFAMQDVYGYHARVFTIAINTKINQLLQQLNQNKSITIQDILNKIIYLLKKSINFLRIFEDKNKNKNSKIQYKIQQYSRINPNQKIRQIFIILKNKLIQTDYNYIIHEIQNQISKEELKILLNKSVRQSRVIFKFK